MADAPKPAVPATKYEPPKELESRAAVQKFLGRAKRTPFNQAEYFYNVKATHIVFFLSSLGMLISFILMFHKDYDRGWKEYQKEFQNLEFEKLWYDMSDLEKGLQEKKDGIDALGRQIKTFLANFPVDMKDARELKVAVLDAKTGQAPKDKPAAVVTVHVYADPEKEKLKIRESEEIRRDHYEKQQQFNFGKDALGEVRYRYEEAKHHYEEGRKHQDPRLPEFQKHLDAVQKEWDEVNALVARRKKEFDEVDTKNSSYEDIAAQLETWPVPGVWDGDRKPLNDLKKERASIRKEYDEKKLRFEKEKPSFANTIRNKPMTDFFAPTLKVQQAILPDLKDQLHFVQVEKVDRCHTCHVGIGNPYYAVDVEPKAEKEVDRYTFKKEFLRKFVAHARGTVKDKCEICGNPRPEEAPEPLTKHGSWTEDDTVKFTKSFMAHPRLDLFVQSSSKHPLEKFGCTVCHEGDGRDTEFSRVVHLPNSHEQAMAWKRRHGTPYGEELYNWNYRELWDLPMFPSKFAQASCRRCHQESVELDGAEKYVKGMKLFERVGCYGCHRTDSYQILPKDTRNFDLDPNRKFRRPGPPLTRIATKMTEDWAVKWVLRPRDFRPNTRMPHFFGQSNGRQEANKHPYPPAEVNGVRRSPIDDTIVQSVVKYLWSLSDTAPDPEPPALKGDTQRGELLVNQAGCMACHKLQDQKYADNESRYLKEFAPGLSGVGSKMNKAWLYAWVRNPKSHFPESRMPSLRLTEQEATDVVEYLMTLKKPEWEGQPGPAPIHHALLDDLIIEQLRLKMPNVDAEARLKEMNKDLNAKVLWFGRKMVNNFGCYSCHELRPETKDHIARIKAPEEAEIDWTNIEGIGVELTGSQPFGSKHYDRLDFGYTADDGVNHHGITFKHGFTGEELPPVRVHHSRQDWLEWKLRNPRVFDGGKMASKPQDELLRMPDFGLTDYEIELLQTFVLSFTDHAEKKLVENARKRMNADEAAMNRGNRIVRDDNCRACHRLSLDQFVIEWTRKVPGRDGREKDVTSNVEVEGRFKRVLPPEEAQGNLKKWGLWSENATKPEMAQYDWVTDHRTLEMPGAVNPASPYVYSDGRDRWYVDVDEVAGKVMATRPVLRHQEMDGGEILDHIRAFKGDLNRRYKKGREKVEEERDSLQDKIDEEKDPARKAVLEGQRAAVEKKLEGMPAPFFGAGDVTEYEARFPPMLRTQGVKTQADWLFQFLKAPRPIRPGLAPPTPEAGAMPDVNIRMPTFDFGDEEAASLVRWFAVRDHEKGRDTYPHTAIPERGEARLAERRPILERVVPKLRQDCVGCHYWNGKAPHATPADAYKVAPELAEVEVRLRPRWLYAWIDDPGIIYPGTTMTKYGYKEIAGTQEEGVRAAVEFMMNFHRLKDLKSDKDK